MGALCLECIIDVCIRDVSHSLVGIDGGGKLQDSLSAVLKALGPQVI